MKLLVVVVLAACGSSGMSSLRFVNHGAAQSVADRHDMAKPTTREFARTLYMLDVFLARRAPHAMELERRSFAGDINALDEVPDSTWFTNRIGIRDLTTDDIHAAGRESFAAPKGPWTITGTKVGGASIGFLAKDAAGAKFVMKFDSNGAPDMQTGADVVAQKILWAAGFNTPEDLIVELGRNEMILSPKAKVEDVFGNKRPMTEKDLDEALGKVDHEAGGRYRALMSRYLGGEPVGGYSQAGRREDDPNDHVDHQDRRTLRAQRVFFAWLDNTDVKEDNGLDMWIADRGAHYLQHYLVDFGLALGVYGWDQTDPGDGYAKSVDLGYGFRSLIALGIWTRPWEGAGAPPLRGVGRFEHVHYDALIWQDRYPYQPFDKTDEADGFWASKIILRFTEPQLRAAVEEGHYKDPAAVDYLVKELIQRQRKTAYQWFGLVSPLDHITVKDDGTMCFDDLMRVHFDGVGATRYVARSYDYGGHALATTSSTSLGPHACLAVKLASDHDAYTIVELAAERDGEELPAVHVHVARDLTSHEVRVIGIRRGQP